MFNVIDFGEGWRYDHGVVFSSFFFLGLGMLIRSMDETARKEMGRYYGLLQHDDALDRRLHWKETVTFFFFFMETPSNNKVWVDSNERKGIMRFSDKA